MDPRDATSMSAEIDQLFRDSFWAVKPNVSSTHTHTHTHTFNGPFSGTTQVSRYQKSKTNLDFTEARDSVLQWYQLERTYASLHLAADR